MKKHLIILVLKLLETESDRKHPLTQTMISEAINAVYPCDRKTVGRNMRALAELGYPIVKTTRGFYLDRKEFSTDEIRFVEQAIRAASGGEGINRESLLARLLDNMGKPGY